MEGPRLTYKQKVRGSSPRAPTNSNQSHADGFHVDCRVDRCGLKKEFGAVGECAPSPRDNPRLAGA